MSNKYMSVDRLEEKYEDYVQTHFEIDGIQWRHVIDISKILQTDLEETIRYVESEDNLNFIRNKRGQYSTRKLWEEYTSFWNKFLDQYTGGFR